MIQLPVLPSTNEAASCACVVTPHMNTREAQQLADGLQILAHPVRLQILDMLSQCVGNLCVCDIEASLPVKQPTVSHHLRLLREAGLIDGEKRGLYVYYSLRQGAVQALWNQVSVGLTQITMPQPV